MRNTQKVEMSTAAVKADAAWADAAVYIATGEGA